MGKPGGLEKMEIRNATSHLFRGYGYLRFLHRAICDITNLKKLKINNCFKIRKKI